MLKYYFKINIQNKYNFKKSCLNIISKILASQSTRSGSGGLVATMERTLRTWAGTSKPGNTCATCSGSWENLIKSKLREKSYLLPDYIIRAGVCAIFSIRNQWFKDEMVVAKGESICGHNFHLKTCSHECRQIRKTQPTKTQPET